MTVSGIDHIALPTSDAATFLAFYKALGFAVEGEAEWRAGREPIYAIRCGDRSKVNVHPEDLWSPADQARFLRAPNAEPGCGDVCFTWEGGLDALRRRLGQLGIAVLSGPGSRRGARGGGVSLYIRDPDENLLELMSYDPADLDRYAGPSC